jgi:predicted pyridoxine 5'-phosphate oxidase superfamily flavin-nucleotide-binding protein
MPDAQSPFHEGELHVQRRSGVADEAAEVGGIVAASISSGAARFLAGQRMAIAASLDAQGQPWASLLSGPAGFLLAVDERLLRIDSSPQPGEPLAANLAARPELALLVLDPTTRRRMRLNGRGQLGPEGFFLLADQVYGNCPKYIQKRRLVGEVPRAAPPGLQRAERLDGRQQAAIARADTFFIASFHPGGGADASHRGGNPGFVRVVDAGRLAFPDYSGNNMFNTLGNLVGYPRAGLLFVDFETGDLLQLAGRASLRWEPERAVEFEVDVVLETRGGSALRWELLEYSPTNP